MKWIPVLLFLVLFVNEHTYAQKKLDSETVVVPSGGFELRALLWKPTGQGPFPTIIFCHGSYESNDTRYDPVNQISSIGQFFAREGFVFLGLFRRGMGLSRGQGENTADMMAKAMKESGQESRNKIQINQLQTAELQDMHAGLSFLEKRKEVDTGRIIVVGHSFGGSLALLVAAQEPQLKAAVIFGAAGYSWNLSAQLRVCLFDAIKKIKMPVMIIHAQNDYSLSPGYAFDSVMNLLRRPHELKIYLPFGKSQTEGHNIIFLNTSLWQDDVLRFIWKNIKT